MTIFKRTYRIHQPKRNPHSYHQNHLLDCCILGQLHYYSHLVLHNLLLVLRHSHCSPLRLHTDHHFPHMLNIQYCHNHHRRLHIDYSHHQVHHHTDHIVVLNKTGCNLRLHRYYKYINEKYTATKLIKNVFIIKLNKITCILQHLFIQFSNTLSSSVSMGCK